MEKRLRVRSAKKKKKRRGSRRRRGGWRGGRGVRMNAGVATKSVRATRSVWGLMATLSGQITRS